MYTLYFIILSIMGLVVASIVHGKEGRTLFLQLGCFGLDIIHVHHKNFP